MIRYSTLVSFLIIATTFYSVQSRYHYAGCYEQDFHDNSFESSYMEPELCFHLCQTPIVYIKNSVCRCAWGGLMDYGRQRDSRCTTLCPTAGDRETKTNNTCGGFYTYSAYVEDQFYTRYAKLLDYKIVFRSCELWNSTDYYDMFNITFDNSSGTLGLNRLERCAAACIEQNETIKSIGK